MVYYTIVKNPNPCSPSPFARNNPLVSSVPRCLMLLLETLSIAHYQFSHLGFHSFSFWLNPFPLKHLDMRVVILYALDLIPLRGLLENMADSLETLDLKGCRMKNSQLNALLLALRQCSFQCQLLQQSLLKAYHEGPFASPSKL